MSAIIVAEDCVYLFLKGLEDEELKQMKSGRDVEYRIDEETIEEIKDRIWSVLQHQIQWTRLLEKVKEDIGLNSDDEVEEEDDEETKTDEED